MWKPVWQQWLHRIRLQWEVQYHAWLHIMSLPGGGQFWIRWLWETIQDIAECSSYRRRNSNWISPFEHYYFPMALNLVSYLELSRPSGKFKLKYFVWACQTGTSVWVLLFIRLMAKFHEIKSQGLFFQKYSLRNLQRAWKIDRCWQCTLVPKNVNSDKKNHWLHFVYVEKTD